MVTEASGLFLKLTLIYLYMYHKQNILDIYAGINIMFRTTSLGEVSGNSCEFVCLPSLRIYVIWSCLHSSSPTQLAHNSGQLHITFAEEITRMEETGALQIKTELHLIT